MGATIEPAITRGKDCAVLVKSRQLSAEMTAASEIRARNRELPGTYHYAGAHAQQVPGTTSVGCFVQQTRPKEHRNEVRALKRKEEEERRGERNARSACGRQRGGSLLRANLDAAGWSGLRVRVRQCGMT